MAESSPHGKKPMWKKEKLLVMSISPFPTVFSKDLYCRHAKTRACLGKGEESEFQILKLYRRKLLKGCGQCIKCRYFLLFSQCFLLFQNKGFTIIIATFLICKCVQFVLTY